MKYLKAYIDTKANGTTLCEDFFFRKAKEEFDYLSLKKRHTERQRYYLREFAILENKKAAQRRRAV